MKLKLLLLSLIVLGAGACTQQSCPTYAKENVQIEKNAAEANS